MPSPCSPSRSVVSNKLILLPMVCWIIPYYCGSNDLHFFEVQYNSTIMLHIINLYHLLSVASGAAALLIVILVAKFRRSLLKRYLAFFTSLSTVVLGIATPLWYYFVPNNRNGYFI